MKFTITKKVEIEPKYLDVVFGGRVDADDIAECIRADKSYDSFKDFFVDYPMFMGHSEYSGELSMRIRIDVESGKIINMPYDMVAFFNTLKVVDEGEYTLYDADLNEICKYEGYVPNCLQIDCEGYGDYFEFHTNELGEIVDWDFTQDDVNELNNIEMDE